jgi:hypothetical protein
MATEIDQNHTTLLRAHVKVPRHVVYRDFPAETVVLNLNTERYHGLNPTAGQMLGALDRLGSVEEAAGEISRKFKAPRTQVERDLTRLCGQLLDRGLIELVSAPAG